MQLFIDNLVEDATITSSTESPGAPVENIIVRRIGERFSFTTSSGDIFVSYSEAKNIKNILMSGLSGNWTVSGSPESNFGTYSGYLERFVSYASEFGDEVWVSVGDFYDYDYGGYIGRIQYSLDYGATWIIANGPEIATDDYFNSVTWTNGTFFASTAGGYIFKSINGSDWTVSYTAASILRSITTYNSTIIAVGISGFICKSIDNGLNWTTPVSGHSGELFAVDGDNGYFVAGGDNGIIYSLDGDTWTASASTITDDIKFVIYGNSEWIALGNNGKVYKATTPDIWTEVSDLSVLHGSNISAKGLVWNGTEYVAVGTDPSEAYISTDAITWQIIDPIVNNSYTLITSLGWNGEYYIITDKETNIFSAGTSGEIYITADLTALAGPYIESITIDGDVGYLDLDETYRYWKFSTSDDSGLGLLFMCDDYIQMPGINPDATISYKTTSLGSPSIGRQWYGQKGVNYMATKFSFPIIGEYNITLSDGTICASRKEIIDAYKVVENAIPFYVKLWANNLDEYPPILCVIPESGIEFQKSKQGKYYSLNLSLEEVL